MNNNLIGSNLNYDIPFDINPGGIVMVDYINYMTTDSMHPTALSWDIMMNMVREDEKKIMIVEVETYAE